MLAVEEAASFHPYETASACNRLVLELVTEPLFTVEANGEVTPVLAMGWQVSDDGLTTTVALQEGLLFHNGQPLTAETVVQCVEQAKTSSWYAGRFYALSSVEAANETTVVFTTKKAYECFPRLLDIPICVTEGDLPVGTGPYRFRDGKTLAPFDGWRQETYPAGKGEIALTAVSRQSQLRDGFEYGGISAVSYDPNGVGAVHYSGDFELWGVPTAVMQYVGFNLQKGAFSSRKLRSAVTHAVDRSAVVAQDMGGFAVATTLAVPPDSLWYDAVLAASGEYDLQKLKDVAAGQSATMIVCGEYAQRVTTASRIARAMNECGLSVTVKTLSREEFRKALSAGSFDLYYAETKLSPDFDLTSFFVEGGACAFGGLGKQKEAKELCDLVLSNHGNSYDLQKTVLQEGLICPVVFKTNALGVHRNVFTETSPNLGGWLWK